MAKSNDMPEFHSVKVSLTENIPVAISLSELKAELKAKFKSGLKHPPTMNASNSNCVNSRVRLTVRGGRHHVKLN
ncbi:hypothetical protein SG34_024060 [Thalassomonas viridans]|uniref:Uncharacterized protein n=1 Tax=Thalassomonas viridans TaxID=137584 RepID=A0AAE9Z395_9GAMM|nr:hypothetical protein [Thalassomonas viridans]WDE04382.1 hypothetical protein SG34_024060 [Thalassomonas viridans]